MRKERRSSRWQSLLPIVFIAATSSLTAQTVTVRTDGGTLHVQTSNFRFIDGPVLARLKEGRSVRVDFDVILLARPEGPVVRQVSQGFTLSFDLWEERVAVSRIGSPPRSVSHLRPLDAENWCLDNLTLPVSSLGLSRDTPFWVRLTYRVQNVAPAAADSSAEKYTLGGLIDRLSRRREEADMAKSVVGGPFRLP